MTNAKDSQNTNFSIHKFMISALGLSGTALLVYAYIYSFTSRNMQCFASTEVIAKNVGVAPMSVTRAMKKLTEAGYVQKFGESSFRTNLYAANMTMAKSAIKQLDEMTDDRFSTPPEQNVVPQNVIERVTNCEVEGNKMLDNNRTIIRTITTTSSTRAERESENEKEISFRRYGDEKLALSTKKQYLEFRVLMKFKIRN